MKHSVTLRYDGENHIYFVHESDVPGLHVEASTVDEAIEIIRDVIPDLLGESASDAQFTVHVEELPVAA